MRCSDYAGMICHVHGLADPLMDDIAWELAEAGATVIGHGITGADLDEIRFAMILHGFRFVGGNDPVDADLAGRMVVLPMNEESAIGEMQRQNIIHKLAEAGRGRMVEVGQGSGGLSARFCAFGDGSFVPSEQETSGVPGLSLRGQ